MREDYLNISAPVFNVQTYSIHDGPGIRVTVFLKGCPLRCIWCANPESRSAEPQLMVYSGRCTGCGRCVVECPAGAIAISPESGSAVTDRTLCTDCGKCVFACTVGAREMSGSEMSVKTVLEKVLRDKLFIDASGGGVTLSGGECLMHSDFSEAMLYAAKLEGLHTAVETSCFSGKTTIDRVFKYVDLGLLDIKHMDSARHKDLTGVPNEIILDNIRYIYHVLNVPVTVRVPVVPGYNDSDGNIEATARFVAKELGKEVAIHLLPYHRLGESKNESLGNAVNMSISVPSDDHMERLKAIPEKYGLTAQIGG